MPWKNGGGTTAAIAIAPAGAGIDAFDWRVSMARVDSDGPFSAFSGIDRTLTIIEGAGLHLSVDGESIDLTGHSNPFSFRGEAVTRATRIDGAVVDLNVMSRRDRFTHRVTRISTPCEIVPAVGASIALLFCCRGSVRIESGQRRAELEARDSLLLENPHAPLRLASDASALSLLIEIWPADAQIRRP